MSRRPRIALARCLIAAAAGTASTSSRNAAATARPRPGLSRRRRAASIFAAAVLVGMAICRPAAPCAAAEFGDDLRGVSTLMPDGSRTLFPDRTKWAFTLAGGVKWPGSFGDGTNWLQANGECQVYYSPFESKIGSRDILVAHRYNPFSFGNDGLHIRAALLTAGQMSLFQLKPSQRFGSGILISRVAFQQGHVEIVAQLPSASGSWPAFWLLPADGAWPPEIDIMEGMAWGRHATQVHSGMISPDSSQTFADWFPLKSAPAAGMHTYSLDWTRASLTVFFDGAKLWSQALPASFNRPMYLLINLAVGGTWVYNELGVRPIGSAAEPRLESGSKLIGGDYPSDLIVRSVKIDSPTMSSW